MCVQKLIAEIVTKQIIPTKIYKGKTNNLFTIEVVCTNTFVTQVYKTEQGRDTDFIELDNKAFWKLTFNPYNTPIPGPPM